MAPIRHKARRWGEDSSTPAQKRGPWSNAEDETLRDLVSEKGAGKWVQISEVLQTRTPKQCRERWHQNLKPDLNHDPINDVEGQFIEDQVRQVGKKWAEIARMMNNRSDNAVKNWWNGGENRRKREQTRASEASHMHAYGQPIGHSPYHTQYPPALEAHPFESLRLPPLQPGHIPAPIRVPDARRPIDPAEPSPLSAQAPSLISDAGTEASIHRSFHAHRTSFNLPPPRELGSPISMGRTRSNESYLHSPIDRHHLGHRVTHMDESSSVVRTNVACDRKVLPSIETLAGGPPSAPLRREMPSPVEPRLYPGAASNPHSSSASPVLLTPEEKPSLPTFRDFERMSSGPEEGTRSNRMALNRLCL